MDASIKNKAVRKITLKNSAAVVARMQIKWEHEGEENTYEETGYHDVLVGQEHTIDLANTDIPNGAMVKLKINVVAARDKKAMETYKYDKNSTACAKYELTGTTIQKDLELISYTK